MLVHSGGKTLTRYKDHGQWIEEAIQHFGEAKVQKSFWNLAFKVSDIGWKISGKNHFFPPRSVGDWFQLLKNDPRDVWVLPYALRSVKDVASEKGISNPEIFRFLDEQLMISAQAGTSETPFLFGAPACTYTNAPNFSVPGGLIEMIHTLKAFIEINGGEVRNNEKVVSLDKEDDLFTIMTEEAGKKFTYRGQIVISNIPNWNMSDITTGRISSYFSAEGEQYENAWGAFTMGIVVVDRFGPGMALHHQIHLSEEDKTEGLISNSNFVSLSHPDDTVRSPDGYRTVNVSTLTEPEWWFQLNGNYEVIKQRVQEQILTIIVEKLPGFKMEDVKLSFSSTPVTWNNWVYRKKGRVGGIPQQMDRSLLDWTPNETPFEGLFLVGDTVFPGQGIPGVTLS